MRVSSLKLTKLVITFCIGLHLTPAQSETVTIKGSRSCGTWIQDRKINDAIDSETWVIGYLSGIAVSYNKDILRNSDNSSLYLWIDNYCQKNPLNRISHAAKELANELAKINNL